MNDQNNWNTLTESVPSVDITFRNLDDQDAKAIIKWRDYFLVLWEFDQELRNIIKHGGANIKDMTPYESMRESLWEAMGDYGVSFDDLN
jgi:hypothetical protein